ncbi:MAG: hypothetical protein ACKPKW_20275, partial [Dolichospermum sp.]
SKFQLIPTAIAQTNNSPILGCWITGYNTGERLNKITLKIYGNYRWESKVNWHPILPDTKTSGKWYIQRSQLVTESEDGSKGTLVLINSNQLQRGGLVFNRCN